jgi:hypothetical protein
VYDYKVTAKAEGEASNSVSNSMEVQGPICVGTLLSVGKSFDFDVPKSGTETKLLFANADAYI